MMSIAEIMYKNNVDVYDLEAGNWIIPTEEIYVYDMNNEKQKITKIYINGIKKLYEIKDDEGNTYKFTEEHKVLTKDGWKEVKNLSESDEIISY
jgi:intein/homing endonuclease